MDTDMWGDRWPCRCMVTLEGPRNRKLNDPSVECCTRCGHQQAAASTDGDGLWRCYCDGVTASSRVQYAVTHERTDALCETCGAQRDLVCGLKAPSLWGHPVHLEPAHPRLLRMLVRGLDGKPVGNLFKVLSSHAPTPAAKDTLRLDSGAIGIIHSVLHDYAAGRTEIMVDSSEPEASIAYWTARGWEFVELEASKRC